MSTITIKNIPTDLYERLKQSARANRRSINSEIIVCIERAVSYSQVEPVVTIARARELRAMTEAHPIADQAFTQAKAAGRP